ncbi:MAG: transcriptional regulator NrdR [Planctomycetota bacterium]
MRCPFCGVDNDKVSDSRNIEEGTAIRRRRVCNACNARFTTYERIEETPLKVIKSDQSRVDYSRAKVRLAIATACRKLDVDDETIDRIVARIEQQVLTAGEREVSSQRIGEQALLELRKVHPVAYVRFLSVFRKFTDPVDFADAVQTLLPRAPRSPTGAAAGGATDSDLASRSPSGPIDASDASDAGDAGAAPEGRQP